MGPVQWPQAQEPGREASLGLPQAGWPEPQVLKPTYRRVDVKRVRPGFEEEHVRKAQGEDRAWVDRALVRKQGCFASGLAQTVR